MELLHLSWQWSSYAPPEGFVGSSWGGYNICTDQAYSYYNSPGDSVTLTMPVIDLSGLNNITSMKVYLDVLHARADNYQDRIEFVARSGSDPGDLGKYLRETGTPVFEMVQLPELTQVWKLEATMHPVYSMTLP